jgi:hypothetical protein
VLHKIHIRWSGWRPVVQLHIYAYGNWQRGQKHAKGQLLLQRKGPLQGVSKRKSIPGNRKVQEKTRARQKDKGGRKPEKVEKRTVEEHKDTPRLRKRKGQARILQTNPQGKRKDAKDAPEQHESESGAEERRKARSKGKVTVPQSARRARKAANAHNLNS